MSIKKTIVLLAGGLGSRYNGLKQVERILANNSTILEYSLFDAIKSGFTTFVFIINSSIPESFVDKISKILTERNLEFHWVIQKTSDFAPAQFNIETRTKPWGTGHAVLCAKPFINEVFLVINADDFYGRSSFEKASQLLDSNQISANNYSLIAYPLKNTLSNNGSVSRGLCSVGNYGKLQSIRELTKIKWDKNMYAESEGEKELLNPDDLVSMNFWILHPSFFSILESEFQEFLKCNPSDKGEFFLPSAIEKSIQNNNVTIKVDASKEIWKGITYPEDKLEVQNFLQSKTDNHFYPENLWS